MNRNSTLGRGDIGFASAEDVELFVETLARYERGEIDADAWRAFRLVNGTYGQRQTGDESMLRVKIPQGILSADQLEVLGGVAERYSRGFLHLTTRQNIQLHFVPLGKVGDAMGELAAAGLTTKEACGNAVRNITTSATAGVAADEAFDATPYAEAMTRYFLGHPLSSSLPRKFKMAFACGGADHAFALVNDIGWHAKVEEHEGRARRGFRVTVGGGTAIWCQSGKELFPFLPAEDILAVAEAILRVFHARGDRVHRHKNRMKFLIKAMGYDAWKDAVHEALRQVVAEGAPRLPFVAEEPGGPAHLSSPPPSPGDPRRPAPPSPEILRRALAALVDGDAPHGPGILPSFPSSPPASARSLPVTGDARDELTTRFLRTNVAPQKQPGFAAVTVTVPLGDLSTGRLRALALLARTFGDGEVRVTPSQNLLLRFVPQAQVSALHDGLRAIGLAEPDPDSIADVTSCPGAESCKLAVTQSRGLARDLGERFRRDRDLVDRAAGLVVKVSGCPNGCGLHHVAGLGFQGGLRKIDGRPVPQYHVYVGGEPGGDAARFGRMVSKIPARRVGEAVERIVALYEARREPGEAITAYLGRAPLADVRKALADLEALDATTASAEDYVDLGETSAFAPETSEGECVA